MSSSAHAPTHEHRSTRSHTRVHSHMLPPTNRTGSTQKHCTGTSSLHTHITQSSCGRAVHKSLHSHARAHAHAPLARTHLHARITRSLWMHTAQKHMLPHTSHTGSVRRHREDHRLTHTRRTQCSSLSRTHAQHMRTYSHFTAARTGFYPIRGRPVHVHKHTHEIRIRSEACT